MAETQVEQIERVENALYRRVNTALEVISADGVTEDVKTAAFAIIKHYLQFQLVAKPDDTPGGMTSHDKD